jgi:hypothetical protein
VGLAVLKEEADEKRAGEVADYVMPLTKVLCHAYDAKSWGGEGAGTPQDKEDTEGGTAGRGLG